MFAHRTFTPQIFTTLLVCALVVPLMSSLQPAHAARIRWCMQVVPSGELVTRYGASCRFQSRL